MRQVYSYQKMAWPDEKLEREMLSDVARVEKALRDVGSPCTSPVADCMCHLKAVLTELRKVQAHNKRLVDRIGRMHAAINVTMETRGILESELAQLRGTGPSRPCV